ncbi:MAG: DUF2905 domain-containing protein [Anaerolineales bacterium]|jgi:hypothetical protein|nr:MAG: DUF2905 domain-containing protein [Anaerolineales bacterium]
MPDLTTLARWLVLAGLILAGIGGLLSVFSRLGLPLGRLPGDFRFQSGSFTCFIPVASSILLSVLLTLILNLIARLSK